MLLIQVRRFSVLRAYNTAGFVLGNSSHGPINIYFSLIGYIKYIIQPNLLNNDESWQLSTEGRRILFI